MPRDSYTLFAGVEDAPPLRVAKLFFGNRLFKIGRTEVMVGVEDENSNCLSTVSTEFHGVGPVLAVTEVPGRGSRPDAKTLPARPNYRRATNGKIRHGSTTPDVTQRLKD